jgi:hypothetical protein
MKFTNEAVYAFIRKNNGLSYIMQATPTMKKCSNISFYPEGSAEPSLHFNTGNFTYNADQFNIRPATWEEAQWLWESLKLGVLTDRSKIQKDYEIY